MAATIKPSKLPFRRPSRATWRMLLVLAAGISLAMGHHFFYKSLNHEDTSSRTVGLGGLDGHLSAQQFNLAVGAMFAFLFKSCLGVAVAIAHDQAAWFTIRSQPTKVEIVDGLLEPRSNIFALLRWELWRADACSMFLALIYWLLPIAALVAPATLGLELVTITESRMMEVPQVDFTSLNFAFMAGDAMNGRQVYTYKGPEHEIQRILYSTASAGQILPISPPAPNSSWNVAFHGPTLKCMPMSNTTLKDIFRPVPFLAEPCSWDQLFLAWAPERGDPCPYKLADGEPGKSADTPEFEFRYNSLGAFGGKPVTLFVGTPSAGLETSEEACERSTESKFDSNSIIFAWLRSLPFIECTLYEASFTAGFEFVNGQQTVNISPQTLGDGILYTAGDGLYAPINATSAKQLAYQAIMDAFSRIIIGTLSAYDQGDVRVMAPEGDGWPEYRYLMKSATRTKMFMTPLVFAEELAFLSSESVVERSDLKLDAQKNKTIWDGTWVSDNRPRSQSMAEIIEEMFTNATISLMSSAILQPNDTSPYAPSKVNVTISTMRNSYSYSQRVLWTAYSTAIVAALISITLGFRYEVQNGDSYTTSFLTILKVLSGASISPPLRYDEMEGKGTAPTHIKARVLRVGHLVMETEQNKGTQTSLPTGELEEKL
jgi:hypothetical protein